MKAIEIGSLKERLDEAGMCMCSMVEYEFVREAGPEDEEESRLFCERLPS